MKNTFISEGLSISLRRLESGSLALSISSDYAQSNRKSRLYINNNSFAEMVKESWKSIKTSKLQKLVVDFDPIDHYDDMTDIYEVPVFSMRRGERTVKIGSNDHGSIPKDWGVEVRALIADTKTITPVLEITKVVLGGLLTKDLEAKFVKEAKKVLQKKSTSAFVRQE